MPVWLGFQVIRAQGRTPSKVQQTNGLKNVERRGVGLEVLRKPNRN